MKKYKISLVFFIMTFLLFTIQIMASELIEIETFDSYNLTGKLDLPENTVEIKGLVIYVPGTGPCTYENHRKIGNIEFNYFDLFVNELTSKGIAFFRYNTRGTSIGENPPYYDTVNKEIFNTNTPLNHTRDVEKIVERLREKESLKNVKIILMGWSEGTVISSLVAERNNVDIEAIFLAGYENDTIPETIEWQLTGGSSMIFYRKYFDADQDGFISKIEFNNGPEQIKQQTLQGVKFEQIDLTKDGFLSQEDFRILLSSRYQQVINAFKTDEDDWIWNNYFRISTDWYLAHTKLEPNKNRLVKLNLPIYIFHGIDDQNVPVEGVYDIKSRFEKSGKNNLHTFIFEDHDHDLNYLYWPTQGIISEGLNKLFIILDEFLSN